jgi:hypothetical protein
MDMLRRAYCKETRVALATVLEELKEYGLDIEINSVTLEIIIVDLNSKWRS